MFKLPDTARWQLTSRLIRSAVGLLLLVTAGMKLYDLLYGQAAALLWLPSPRWILGAVEIETLIGLWLLSGWQARWAWMVTLFLFTGLAAISFYLGLTGQSSCGCMGRVEINPWWMFGIDLTTLALLTVCRPQQKAESHDWPWLRQAILSVGGAILMLGIISVGMLLSGTDPGRLLAQLRGETIQVDPFIYDAGTGASGEKVNFTIHLMNTSDKPIRIVGGTSSCSCVTTDDLPITIRARESCPINIRMKFTGNEGRFQQRYSLFTSDELNPRIVARFIGTVIHSELNPVADASGRR